MNLLKAFALGAFAVAILVVGTSQAKADPVTFSTTGAFSVSGITTVTFTNGSGSTTLTFTGTTNAVNTPVGVSFGDIVVTSTNALGNAITGNFTLNIVQIAPPGAGSLVGALSGTLAINSGIATLTFSTTSLNIGGFTYTVNPSYTLAVPVSGDGGGAAMGTTTIQGTVTGSAIPEPASMVLLGTGLLGLGAAVRRRYVAGK